MSQLPLSGERVIEDDYQSSPGMYAIYLMHLACYQFARQYTVGKRVLDLGCGSGYGAALIAETAQEVVAVDVSDDAVTFAASKYPKSNLGFMRIFADDALPFPDHGFDVVLSFQVIEHVVDDHNYINEARRMMACDGVLIVVTPNRTVRLFAGQKPWNRWHVREYDATTLSLLLDDGSYVTDLKYMTAREDVAALELNRYRKLKWMTLPITMPWMPDVCRVAGLNLLHALRGQDRRPGSRNAPFGFAINDIYIGSDESDALNLVAVTKRKAAVASDVIGD